MWIEKIVGDLGDKKRWKEYRARLKALPPAYESTGRALERYLLYFGPSSDPQALLGMVDALADLMEQSAAAGTPIRDIVGEDPVEFAETFLANYSEGGWVHKERARLASAIDDAAGRSTQNSTEADS